MLVNLNSLDVVIAYPTRYDSASGSADGERIIKHKFIKSDHPLVLMETAVRVGKINGIPVTRVTCEGPSYIPEEINGWTYLVGMVVAKYFASIGRMDFVGPSQLKMVYENGRPSYTKGLVQYSNRNPVSLSHRADEIGERNDIELVNLTGSPITVISENGDSITIPAASSKASIPIEETPAGEIDEFPVAVCTYGEITGLPDPDPSANRMYIVTLLFAGLISNRSDIVIPDFGPSGAVRGEGGRIIGTRGFILP